MKDLLHSFRRRKLWIVALLQALFPVLTLAASPTYQQSGPITDYSKIGDLLNTVVAGWIFGLLITISILMVLYGAFLYMTAGGNPEKVSTANKVLIYAAVGIVVALLAKGLPALINSLLSAGGGGAYSP